jgi:ElaB/YqjD/DUF883 family membrane-anchored ribosome-binding protein
MQPDTARVWGNGGSLGRVQEMMTPVRDRLEDAARDLAQVLAKAGESVKKIQPEDVAALMRRSPLTAMAVAAGVGFIAGLLFWPRGR